MQPIRKIPRLRFKITPCIHLDGKYQGESIQAIQTLVEATEGIMDAWGTRHVFDHLQLTLVPSDEDRRAAEPSPSSVDTLRGAQEHVRLARRRGRQGTQQGSLSRVKRRLDFYRRPLATWPEQSLIQHGYLPRRHEQERAREHGRRDMKEGGTACPLFSGPLLPSPPRHVVAASSSDMISTSKVSCAT